MIIQLAKAIANIAFHRWSLPSVFLRKGPAWRLTSVWPCESRASMRESLIRMLAIAHRERLDVAPLVENLAR
ncbi:MAG: hypothetical protein ABL921_30530, partial [Pirellula sp.]